MRTSAIVRLERSPRSARGERLRRWLLWVTLALSVACASHRPTARIELDPPKPSTSLGPGDVFILQVVGEKDLPDEYQVGTDGTVDLPYLERVEVAGLEPQQLARLVRQRLVEEQILRSPSVVVRVKEYRSKQVSVLGQVQRPGSFPHEPGMTLIQAVSLAGGLNSIAQTRRVRLTRQLPNGKSRTVLVDLGAINAGEAEDIPLQVGDRIFIEERVF